MSTFQFDTVAGEQAKVDAALAAHLANQPHSAGTAYDMGYAILGDVAYGAITPGYDLGYNILPALHSAIATGRPVWVPPGLWDTAGYTGNTLGQILINQDNVAIHMAKGAFIRDTTTGTSSWWSAFISHGTSRRTSKVNKLAITGQGEFTTKAGTGRSKIVVWGDDILFADFAIRDWEGGLAFSGGGNRMRGTNVKATRPTAFVAGGNGGWRYSTGDDSTFNGLHIEAADDCLQAVPMQASFAHPWANTPIRRLTYVGCTGKSGARFIAAVNSDKTYAPWTPSTVYAAAAKVSVVQGDGSSIGYTANSAHTSGATFTGVGWTSVGAVGMTSDIDVSYISCKGFGGQRSVAIRNEGPSKGTVRASLVDCDVDASLSTIAVTSSDFLVLREDNTGTVDATITNSPILNPRAVSLTTTGDVDVKVNGGKWVANVGAVTVFDVAGTVSIDQITTTGCGTANVIRAGSGGVLTKLRVNSSDFLGIPVDTTRSVINLQDAPGARIIGNRPVGGMTYTKFVSYNALSINTVSTGNDLTGLGTSGPWSAAPNPLPTGTVIENNPGDPTPVVVAPTVVPETVSLVATAGSSRTLPDLPVSIHDLTLTANAGCACTLPDIYAGTFVVKVFNSSASQTRSITYSPQTGTTLVWLPTGAATQTVGIGKAQVAVFRCFGDSTVWYGKVTDGDYTP